ncbi:MAG: DNA-binding response regulator [Bacteroidetes bacterium GWA2_32_17]|nr:MAG: DNA-binding response regulator [Bacteroidetes bacterium GWA2_32_17]
MNNNSKILIIDDERQIRKLIVITLESNNFYVLEAATAKEGLQMAAMHPPDLIILDLGLPDEDGQSVLVKLRDWYISPIIILSVRDAETDIIQALDNGANDYLVKPFRTGELLARIRNALRNKFESNNQSIITFQNITIDLVARIVKKDNAVLKLTSTEYSLITLLARNENKVLTHQFILREIWGPGYVEQSQYLRVFIAQIRKKIEENPNQPKIIITESGIGYRLVGEDI